MFAFNMFLNSIPNNELHNIMKTEAQMENQALLMELFNRWSNLAITRFDWEGLPPGVDERILNMGLYFQGTCAFFIPEGMSVTALPCTFGSRFNFLYQPQAVNVYGYGYSKYIDNPDDFGFLRVSPTGIPLAISVYTYCKRMADTLRAIDVINQRMKRPYVFTVDEKQRLTIENLFKRIKDNEELIIGLKDYPLDKSTFDVAPLPYQGNTDQLWKSYYEYERILSTLMGINTVPIEKKERLISAEANSNNMVIEMQNEVNLKELKLCIDIVNEKFGLNISVSLKEVWWDILGDDTQEYGKEPKDGQMD